MIEIENLSFRRGAVPILLNINLKVPNGGIAAIIGPNGAGKSTLLHCIAGLLTPANGRVWVDSVDVYAVREGERARLMALLTQHAATVPRLSVRDLVTFGRWPHHRGRPTREDVYKVTKALDVFELKEMASQDVEALSGGQRQRAFLAMAYAQDTPWMMLDEPLAALDPKYVRDIMDRLRALSGPKRSVVMVLHDLSTAARYADWCVALKAGRVFSSGSWEDTATSEALSELYETPLRLETVSGGAPVVVAGD
ncbi:MAG: ABC transporter ATP-binding protein [Pseudomonadota bacterium]